MESGSDFGGTWYWNRYPNAACDIESYIYFPLLEETGYMPAERYSKAPEIRAHCRRIAERYGLYDRAAFSTQVKALAWDEGSARWLVKTDRGDDIRARFVVLTTGPLNRPKLPAIPGIETFAGHSFHTSRWDYAYTGGSETAPMDRLGDKRVGVIGTGATSIQCVPPLAKAAQHLYLFQRTPSSVDARGNHPTDPQWWASLEPGWQQERLENFTAQFTQDLPPNDLVHDGWTVLARAVREKFVAAKGAADPGALLEQADLEKMADIRDRISHIVDDPATAEALKPWFSLYCKRPCFSDEYLQSFNRPNVTLVDTAPRGVERITPTGVVAKGVEYPLDCLIFATGFETSTSYAKRSGMEIHGAGGVSLTDRWSAGMSTLYGLQTRDFPNLFIVSQAQAGMSPNFPHMLSEQTVHIAHIVEQCLKRHIASVQPTAQAEQELGRHHRPPGRGPAQVHRGLHARLLQQRRPAVGRRGQERALRRGRHRLHQAAPPVARAGRFRRPGDGPRPRPGVAVDGRSASPTSEAGAPRAKGARPSCVEPLGVPAQVVGHECGDEVVAVVVAGLEP